MIIIIIIYKYECFDLSKALRNANMWLILNVCLNCVGFDAVQHCDTQTHLGLGFWLNSVAHDTNPFLPKAQAQAQA